MSNKLVSPHLADAIVFPVSLIKTPAVAKGTDWKAYRDELPKSATGYGVNCGPSGLYVIDLDRNHSANGSEPVDGVSEWKKLLANLGVKHVNTLTVKTPSGGVHFYYRMPAGLELGNTADKLAPGVDTRGAGGYVVGPGSETHPKEMVRNAKGEPELDMNGNAVFEFNKRKRVAYTIHTDAPIAELPAWIVGRLASESRKKNAQPVAYNYETSNELKQWQEDALREACARIATAGSGARDKTIQTEATNIGLKLGPKFAGIAVPRLQAAAVASGHETDPEGKAQRHFEFGAQNHDPNRLKSSAPRSAGSYPAFVEDNTEKRAGEETAAYTPDYFTDIATGRRYAEALQGTHLFVNEWKDWARFSSDEGIWEQDWNDGVHAHLFDYLKGVFDVAQKNGDKAERMEAKALLGLRRAESVLRIARTPLTVSSRVFDQQRDHLLVGNGVVDLRTGELRAVTPEDRFTKRSDVRYEAGARSPLLKKLLASFPDDTHDYLQVLAGQALTGHQPSTSNASVFFFNGDGKNGKSTFMNCLQRIAGTSAAQMDPGVLLSSAGSNNQFAFMPFKGARLAVFEELPDAKHLDAQAVKSLAGTAKKRASEKFQKSEEVEITATIFIATNFLPAVAESDFGTWRRLVVIPSPYTFVDADALDPNDPTQRALTPELVDAQENTELLEALMAWAVEGAIRWYANGRRLLDQPDSIREASEKWRNRDDRLGSWLEEELTSGDQCFVLIADAYDSYVAYTRANGQQPQNSTRWLDALKQSPKAKEMGAMYEGKARLKKLTRSLYVPDERFKSKVEGDFTRQYVPREAGEQASIIKGVRFKNDFAGASTKADRAPVKVTKTTESADFDADAELAF